MYLLLQLRGTLGKDASWPETYKMCNLISIPYSYHGFISMHAKEVLFSSSNLSFSWCSHVCSLLTNEEQKGLACDVMDTFDPHASCVHDIRDTDCQTQWQPSWLWFWRKKLWVCFYSVPVQRAHGPPLLGVPFNCSHGNLHYRIHHRALLKMLALPAYTRAVNNIKSLLISGSP